MVIEVPGNERDVDVAGLADGLAVVERLQDGKEPAVLQDLPGQRVQIPGPGMTTESPPLGLGRSGGTNRPVHVARTGLGQPPDRLAGRRVQRLEGLSLTLRPSAGDKQSETPAVTFQPGVCRPHRLRGGTVRHRLEDLRY
jgi:hypothetical protein